LIKSEYERLVEEFGLVRMNATENLIVQQARMRSLIEPYLQGVSRPDDGGLNEALLDGGLLGRYLAPGIR
jgi:hypothetical protein